MYLEKQLLLCKFQHVYQLKGWLLAVHSEQNAPKDSVHFSSPVISLGTMANVTTCQVKNLVDNKLITISTRWNEDDMEILILQEGEQQPLQGKALIKDLLKPAKTHKRTEDVYLTEIQRELAGKDGEIEFSLKENVLYWKKKIWLRGLIKCEPIENITSFSSLVASAMAHCANVEETTSSLKEENDILKKKAVVMEKIMHEMIESKKRIEEELYKRFIILLNSKKRKYRALKAQLPKSPTVYDESTDESETEEEDQNSDVKKIKTKQLNDSQDSVNNNSCATIFKNITMAIQEQCKQPENLNSSNDSDESFILKISQSPPRNGVNKKNITNGESDDDLFAE